MRVLRLFLSSVLVFAALSVDISLAWLVGSGPPASWSMIAVPSLTNFNCSVLRLLWGHWLLLAVRARHRFPDFFGNPDRPDQQINRSLKECWFVAFDPVP